MTSTALGRRGISPKKRVSELRELQAIDYECSSE
jgi:hypothetical protein